MILKIYYSSHCSTTQSLYHLCELNNYYTLLESTTFWSDKWIHSTLPCSCDRTRNCFRIPTAVNQQSSYSTVFTPLLYLHMSCNCCYNRPWSIYWKHHCPVARRWWVHWNHLQLMSQLHKKNCVQLQLDSHGSSGLQFQQLVIQSCTAQSCSKFDYNVLMLMKVITASSKHRNRIWTSQSNACPNNKLYTSMYNKHSLSKFINTNVLLTYATMVIMVHISN